MLRDPDIRDAGQSVFKIRSNNRCGSGVEGTGFLYAPGRLMTNAHVVAGVTEPMVQVGDESVDGTVVYYNPDVDVAVIDVPDLDGPTIRFDLDGKESQQGAVLGFPQDGPFDAQPARIRGDQRLRSPDIYGNGTVTRHVFSLRGLIRPGNSGGPVVSTDGTGARGGLRRLGQRQATPATRSPPTRSPGRRPGAGRRGARCRAGTALVGLGCRFPRPAGRGLM